MGLGVGSIWKQHWHRLEITKFSMVFYIQGTDQLKAGGELLPPFTFLLILPQFASVRYFTCRSWVLDLLKLADNYLKKAPSPVFTFFLVNTKQLKQFQKFVILVNNNLGK